VLANDVAIELPTDLGSFTLRYHSIAGASGVSLTKGSIGAGIPIVRVQSSCLFSESFNSINCDCALQLRGSLEIIAESGCGVLVYQFEEGRGAGLQAKIMAIALEQRQRIDTVEAFRQLGLPPDLRNYEVAASILRALGVSERIALITNNPEKREGLEKAGFLVERIIAVGSDWNDETKAYLRMKRDRLGHSYLKLD
jgi:3,4-dihydroxy 2-butanone 4-phosphate synthase / GTP cyclohydrolase II